MTTSRYLTTSETDEFPQLRILVVEDSMTDSLMLEEVFTEIGLAYEIYFAETGEIALDYLRKAPPHQSAVRPHLIFVDLNLPGMSGHEFLDIIKNDENLKTIPSIVLSTSSSEDDVNGAYERWANSYLVKPVGYDALMRSILSVDHFWRKTAKLPGV